jgi:hypothetical protein
MQHVERISYVAVNSELGHARKVEEENEEGAIKNRRRVRNVNMGRRIVGSGTVVHGCSDF